MYRSIFNDRDYIQTLTVVALPLVLQQVITYSVNLLDTMMIGSFGDATLAAVNLVNQFFLLFSMLMFGAVSGGNVLNAQFWGRRDIKSIHRVMGMQLIFGLVMGTIFLTVSQLFPAQILSIYSKDANVIQDGVIYLRIISLAFLLFPIGQFFGGALRSTGNTRTPMVVSIITLGINALLNFILIFGKLGVPVLGLVGAGIATVIARAVECILYITLTYKFQLPPAASLKEMLSFNSGLAKLLSQKGLPVILNETIWGLGTNTYAATYAAISTTSIAAFSAVSPVDNIAQALFIGVGDASAVIEGALLGAGNFDKAERYSKNTLTLSISLSVITGLLLLGLRTPILSLYNLSAEAHQLAFSLLTVLAVTLWLRTTNYTMIIGILRPGGDAAYALIIETIAMWCIGIPMARILGLRLGLPVYIAYLGSVTEEFLKMLILFRRYFSKKWLVVIGAEEGEA